MHTHPPGTTNDSKTDPRSNQAREMEFWGFLPSDWKQLFLVLELLAKELTQPKNTLQSENEANLGKVLENANTLSF